MCLLAFYAVNVRPVSSVAEFPEAGFTQRLSSMNAPTVPLAADALTLSALMITLTDEMALRALCPDKEQRTR
jgi:hypothetical protein